MPSPSPLPASRRPRQALAIGTLTARLTARIGRKKPAAKTLAIIQKNWASIAPKDFLDHAKPTHLSHAPCHTTLTLTVTQAFAPIALHRTTHLRNRINALLGNDTVHAIKLKQSSSANPNDLASSASKALPKNL